MNLMGGSPGREPPAALFLDGTLLQLGASSEKCAIASEACSLERGVPLPPERELCIIVGASMTHWDEAQTGWGELRQGKPPWYTTNQYVVISCWAEQS